MEKMRRLLVLVLVVSALASAPAAARSVSHAMGETEVPDTPRRVVVLTNEGTEALLALGVKPVGAVRSWLGDPWYEHIAPRMNGVMMVGTEHAPNLEVIAALKPDLIIGNKLRQEAIYHQLSAIAPTVMSNVLRGAWQDNMRLYADALGLGTAGQQQLDAFDARARDLAEALGPRLDEAVSLVRFMPGTARIYYKDSFAGGILERVGFARPQPQDKDAFADQVIKERIPDMDGDRLFYFVFDTGDGTASEAAADWMREPLWKSLSAVQAGRVHEVSDATWNTSGGIIAARMMLDDLEQIYGLE
ncbi:Iron(III) dicitrate transport system, periplasmic iron-binding protein FecB [Caenispirillum salinarum AK4]|uniref:Iron(III) dicitrate transport system, periplasmic iron-binding protein FecB n=1 Tax=Caenispirillum salinarum AK4 TaxID=1238182 RepID=K9H471_9PROT|nr:iron-siderophore ABC transporter substrate-binding protein [Caenispirillum salinarum]EKV31884.1 Iron(III) dicitrate transport system, periplasmic iron-binding protein FecB [Caenispirillum salinarum AK4]